MPEFDNNDADTAEQLSQELVQFVQSAEFGSPEYKAASDYIDHQALYLDLRQVLNDVFELKNEPEKRLAAESRLRINEIKIAFLEHNIRQNQSDLKGYSDAYNHIDASLGDIAMLASNKDEKVSA